MRCIDWHDDDAVYHLRCIQLVVGQLEISFSYKNWWLSRDDIPMMLEKWNKIRSDQRRSLFRGQWQLPTTNIGIILIFVWEISFRARTAKDLCKFHRNHKQQLKYPKNFVRVSSAKRRASHSLFAWLSSNAVSKTRLHWYTNCIVIIIVVVGLSTRSSLSSRYIHVSIIRYDRWTT